MNKRQMHYNFGHRLKMSFYVTGAVLLFSIAGCAFLQGAPPFEIPASRLFCGANPYLVDGNLETAAVFDANGMVVKELIQNGDQTAWRRSVIGSLKTEMLIKLGAPTYITYVEVYPASIIPHLALDTTAVEKESLKWLVSFTAIKDQRGKTVKGPQPVKFRIGREILYLRLTANALEDLDNVSRRHEPGGMQIPLKGAAIREVKFYGQ